MCGLAGFLDPKAVVPRETWPAVLEAMGDAIRHRGPDDSGQFIDQDAGAGLGFRRLSILDLSLLGHQPMQSADGRYVLLFNGEIYNFAELRAELEAKGHSFRGRSDTEVMLAAFVEWGLAATVRFNGMFAYALWDRAEGALHLSRDRAGEKPLYYGWCNGVLLFGSELRALRAHPAFDPAIDRAAVSHFLRFAYIDQPSAIYECIRKVPPATIVTIRGHRTGEPVAYWSAREVAERGEAEPFRGSFEDALRELEALLSDAVRRRMVADVPLGAFLSGGIDSTLVVSLMQSAHSRPVETFSIGFPNAAYDEAVFARAVARHLGTEHTEAYVSDRDALDVVPILPSLYDEPFGDSSAIPTYLLSRLARSRVTVSLSGDGGDELFGGYHRYAAALAWWRRSRALPAGVRGLAAWVIDRPSVAGWQSAFDAASLLLPRRIRFGAAGERIRKVSRVLRAEDDAQLHASLMEYWQDAPSLVLGETPRRHEASARLRAAAHRMMLSDLVSYLPGAILAKVDRATMAVSLEGRMPLLDPRVIEFAWRLPLAWKICGSEGKRILRELLYRRVPKALVARPKMGFGVPLGDWLRGPLRDWAEALLAEDRLRREGYLDPGPIRARWEDHLAGRGMGQHDLWNVLMFQAWLEHAGQRPAISA